MLHCKPKSRGTPSEQTTISEIASNLGGEYEAEGSVTLGSADTWSTEEKEEKEEVKDNLTRFLDSMMFDSDEDEDEAEEAETPSDEDEVLQAILAELSAKDPSSEEETDSDEDELLQQIIQSIKTDL
eukprot:COSAG05_NODE_1143_length_5736_cov_9.876885_4_plen_127_part_00